MAQPFGKGRVAALLIGDLWRWGLHRENPAESDLERAWRQTIRWMVADVPARVEVSARPEGRHEFAGRGPARPGPRRRIPAARQREGQPEDHAPRRRGPHPRRRARRPRSGHLRRDLRHPRARALPGAGDGHARPTARRSASARPAGPHSPPPTSSPTSSPIGNGWNRSPPGRRARSSTATGCRRSSPASPPAMPRSPSRGSRPCGTSPSTS